MLVLGVIHLLGLQKQGSEVIKLWAILQIDILFWGRGCFSYSEIVHVYIQKLNIFFPTQVTFSNFF